MVPQPVWMLWTRERPLLRPAIEQRILVFAFRTLVTMPAEPPRLPCK